MESYGIVTAWILSFIILIFEIKSRRDLRSTYSSIAALQSQTQTSSILSQIESQYINLNDYGYDWFYRFRSLVIINSMMMCLFISDWLQFLTLILKKISIKALSSYLIFAFFIDLLHVIGAIYLIVRYNTYYNIDRTLSRPEEKYYKIFISTEGEGIQPKVIFFLLIVVMVYRMFYQMAFFETFGSLVQTVIKMFISCAKFLVLTFIFVLSFSALGHNLFNDIDDFSTIFRSFNTMYQSIFGGFDFTIYANSSITPEYYGRLFMWIYLLGFAVLIMNFLIAILTDTYSYYTGVANALHIREMIKLRAIFGEDKYYQCLAKAPNLINFYMIIFAPLVIIFKSRKLNSFLLYLEFSFTQFFFTLGLIANLLLSIPLFFIIVAFLKLKYIRAKSITLWDFIIGIIDFVVVMSWFFILTGIIYLASIIAENKRLFTTNSIWITGVYKKQYQYINNCMDGSKFRADQQDLNDFSNQKIYFEFKKFVNSLNLEQIQYDPTDYMISEVFACLLVANLKIIKRKLQLHLNDGIIDDSVPLFVPTEYIVNEFFSSMFIDQHLKSIILGKMHSKNEIIDNKRLRMLISALADKSLGGIENRTEDNEEEDQTKFIEDNGSNLITYVATLKSYKLREQFWSSKVRMLYSNSNSQWILDQFLLCKVFLYLNSIEVDINEVDDRIWNMNQFNKIKSKYLKRLRDNQKRKPKNGEIWCTKNINEDVQDQENEKPMKISIINITMIGPMIGLESKIREIIRKETHNGELPIPKRLKKNCYLMGKATLSRFLSSSTSTWYSACKTYANKT